MSKVTMPDAVTYPSDDWVSKFFGEPDECGFYSFSGDFGNIAYRFQRAAQASNLITTTQAEAYANARVREAQRWQPMETAPAEGRPVLLFAGLYRDGHEYAPTIVVGWHLDKEGWIASGYSGSPIAHLKPKAWMPLPAFPSTPARPESEQ